MELPGEVSQILNKLNINGYEAFVVGGCVRDSLLNKKPTDFDIATSASPQQVKELFTRTVDTGIRHGTVTVLMGKRSVEVTTYRIDGEYVDNRHPENVIFTQELKDDLMRRDFTINAMAYHPKLGYVDYYGGKEDIEKKIIRGVGNPEQRFEEDALRMLRGIRFSATLGFEIEELTKNAIFKKAELIKNISSERIRDEFLKTITSPYLKALTLLTETRLLFYYSIWLQDYCEKNILKIINFLPKCEGNLLFCLVVFFMYADTAKTENILVNLRLDKKTIKEVITLKTYLNNELPVNEYETRKILSVIGEDMFIKLATLKQNLTGCDLSFNFNMLNSILVNNDCFTLKELTVNGSDLIKLGLKGADVGAALNTLLDYVMKNPDKNKKEFLINILAEEKNANPYTRI